MLRNLAFSLAFSLSFLGFGQTPKPSATPVPTPKVLSSHVLPLNDRVANKAVNDVFKYNILLANKYLEGKTYRNNFPSLEDLDKDTTYSFTLHPNQTFALHDIVLPGYKDTVSKTGSAQFEAFEGFKTDGYLMGDGVCHYASLLNWTASDAGLKVYAPTNHDFSPIPDVPRQYGTAIFYKAGVNSSALENLYITNTLQKDVIFTLSYSNSKLQASISASD